MEDDAEDIAKILDLDKDIELPEDFDPTIKPIHAEKYKWGGLGVIRKI